MTTRGPQRRTRTTTVVALALTCAAAACGRDAGGPPVATPSVTVDGASVPRGGVVDVHYRFEIAPDAPPFGESYTVFVHASDEYGIRAWTSDHEPPTATTQWKAGSVVEYTRPMMVPRGAPVGRVTLEVGLYSPRTGTRLTLSGKEGDRRSYRVASFDVGPERKSEFDVRFARGWYAVEAPEDAQGAEWRWSKGVATLLARNPRRDVVLVVDADQPLKTGAAPQRVEVQSDGSPIGSFTLPAGERQMYRVPVTAAQLGSDDEVRFTFSIDRTFPEPRQAGVTSGDARDLGIRVFSVSLEQAQASAGAVTSPGR